MAKTKSADIICLSIGAALKEKVRAHSIKKGISASQFIRLAVQAALAVEETETLPVVPAMQNGE